MAIDDSRQTTDRFEVLRPISDADGGQQTFPLPANRKADRHLARNPNPAQDALRLVAADPLQKVVSNRPQPPLRQMQIQWK